MTEEKKQVEEKFELVQVPTQHELAIQTPEGEVLTIEQATVLILNKLDELNKRL